MNVARRFIVRGSVQGVGFRYFAIMAARRAGIVGTVRNMPDGTVEVVAEGPAESVAEFRKQLRFGPSHAQTTAVDEIEIPVSGQYTGFDVEY